ncbi:MAG: hypothetical protein ACC653_12540 [Gammaproteobacteria bacterium]
MSLTISTSSSSLYNKGNNTCKFYVTSFLLLVLFLCQLNLPIIDTNNFVNSEIELPTEDFENDQLFLTESVIADFHYYLSNSIPHTFVNNEYLNSFLKPKTRAPPLLS